MIIAEKEKTLQIENEAIPYNLRRGKPNRVRLSFANDRTLFIETSTGSLGNFEREFLLSKSNWILKAFLSQKSALDQREQFLAGLEKAIPILGEPTPVQFIPDRRTYFKYKKGEDFLVYSPAHYINAHKKRVLFFALKEFSTRFLERRVEYWSEATGLAYNRLRVKDLKSKWGSCSALQNINLNWQLIFLEEDLLDYVIIHEFMHLREMNHSPRFWAHVAEFDPDYKAHRKQLKEKSWLVGILS